MFARRRKDSLQDKVEDRLREPGRHLILHGPTGVGKTSLVENACFALGLAYIRIPCSHEHTFRTLLGHALAEVSDNEEVGRTESTSRRYDLNPFFGKHSPLRVGRGRGVERTFQQRPRDPKSAVADALAVSGYRVLFLDNFEDLAPARAEEVRVSVGEFIRYLSDISADVSTSPKVVIAGIESASSRLVALGLSTGRRTAQFEIPEMTRDELREILRHGEAKLHVRFTPECIKLILDYSSGLPFYTHLLAQHSAKEALGQRSRVRLRARHVSEHHFLGSLDAVIGELRLSLQDAFERATEGEGLFRPRRAILVALANLPVQHCTVEAIKREVQRLHPFLSTAAASFVDEVLPLLVAEGVISKTTVDGAEQFNFVHLLMKGYIRLAEYNRSRAPTAVTVSGALRLMTEAGHPATEKFEEAMFEIDERIGRFLLIYPFDDTVGWKVRPFVQEIAIFCRAACPLPTNDWDVEVVGPSDGRSETIRASVGPSGLMP
jgi:hypothetical protein